MGRLIVVSMFTWKRERPEAGVQLNDHLGVHIKRADKFKPGAGTQVRRY